MPIQPSFEIDDTLAVRYSYSYGAINPFFEAIAAGSVPFRITVCETCHLAFCPPRHQCQECWQPTTWTDHDGRGTIESVVWAYWIPLDSPARAWTDLPYAYAAIRLDGCRNLLRVRVTGLDRQAELGTSTGTRGQLAICPGSTGRVGDLVFQVS
jgi:uncharacterized OB-fold protein